MVAVHQRDAAIVGKHMRAEPVDEPVHLGDVFGLAGAILLAPALPLPREIVARLAKVGEPGGRDVDRVQPREPLVHRIVDAGALLARQFRQRGIPEVSGRDMAHEEKHRAVTPSSSHSASARGAG